MIFSKLTLCEPCSVIISKVLGAISWTLTHSFLTSHFKCWNPMWPNLNFRFSSSFWEGVIFWFFICLHIPLSGEVYISASCYQAIFTNIGKIYPWVLSNLIIINCIILNLVGPTWFIYPHSYLVNPQWYEPLRWFFFPLLSLFLVGVSFSVHWENLSRRRLSPSKWPFSLCHPQ